MSAVLLEREGAIARIILNRPDAGNAIDMALGGTWPPSPKPSPTTPPCVASY